TRSFHSGIRLSIGHPFADWQNGTPQSMQRAPCTLRCSSFGGVKISAKSRLRSAASRYGTALRGYSMNPVCLPTRGPPSASERHEGRGLVVVNRGFHLLVVALALREDSLVVGRHDLDELREHAGPRIEDARGHGRARVLVMQLDQLAQLRDVLVGLDGLEADRAGVALRFEVAVRVPDIGD